MSRKNKAKAPTDFSQGEDGIQIVIDKPLYDLLKQGKINQVLTWKELKEKPGKISVVSTEDDEPIVLNVKHMDRVGFGYIPKGYPSKYACNKKTTRFHVEIVAQDQQAAATEGDGEAETQ